MEQPVNEGFDRLLSQYGLEREGEYFRIREHSDSTIVMTSYAGASRA